MPHKILVVDDSALSRRRFVAKPLRDAGYEVVEAANGQLGFDAYQEEQPDLIVSDLLMPVLDGFGLLAALQQAESTVPVLVASADIQESSRRKIEELGASGFINKPFTPEQLTERVAGLLAETSQETV